MPVAIFIIAHEPLASALKYCAEHVFSFDRDATARVQALDVPASSSPDELKKLLLPEISAQADAEGALVLTDVLGATPANVACAAAGLVNVAVLGGVNLPMVLSAITNRQKPLAELTVLVRQAGCAAVVSAPLADSQG